MATILIIDDNETIREGLGHIARRMGHAALWSRAMANQRMVAAIAAGELLGTVVATGLDAGALAKAAAG